MIFRSWTAFRRLWRLRRSSRAAPRPALPASQERETATSWVGPFYVSRRLLADLRNDVRPDMALESQFLPVVESRSAVSKYRRTVASADFDRVIASINTGFKIEFGASQ